MKTLLIALVMFTTVTIEVGCAQSEPKDLSLLNHPSLDLTKGFASDSVTTVTGLKNFAAPSAGGACSVCAH